MKGIPTRSFFVLALMAVLICFFGCPEIFAEKPKDTPKKKTKKKTTKMVKPVENEASNTEEVPTSPGSGEPDSNAAGSSASGPTEEVEPESRLSTVSPASPSQALPVRETGKTESPVQGIASSVQAAPAKKESGLLVNCPNQNAKVRIDGILKGNVNETVKIPEGGGEYQIEVFAPGFQTEKVSRKIPDGEVLSFDVLLQPLNVTPVPTEKPVAPPVEVKPPAPVEKGLAGAWHIEFQGSSKAILRKNAVAEIQQNGSSIIMFADTYLPDRTMFSMKAWDLQSRYRWTGTYQNHQLKMTAWKGLLQFEATLSEDGNTLNGKVNSSVNRYHTFVTLRRM